MEDTRVLTLKALDEFIATPSALLAQTLGDIDRLRELKSGLLVDDHPPFSDADDVSLSYRLACHHTQLQGVCAASPLQREVAPWYLQ
ncbi:hypothetical protein K443DRAFT_683499 [Laccaria amethystina LaAM-08-1]|uniref:Uncharacterized protein n=1 Tax=Laccaria amethystina LaAM-08-1 TaxID=1095629 RepID=A0A0C9X0B5_9AGAR|nr:hypothetical protein K443DRAFT_683499 [Laccaria amethystina LaAM-08-1]